MAMTPTYEITPGVGMGPFRLGDTLWHVLELLRGLKTEYPKVEVSWDTERSATIIHLPHLTLYFPHSLHQRLSSLTIPNLPSSSLTLTYETQILSSPSQPLTRAKVGRVLGPTFASTGGGLEFPGIHFELSSGSEGASAGGTGASGGREDAVKGLTVMARQDDEGKGNGPCLESCIIIPNSGVDLDFSHQQSIKIRLASTTEQDLLLDLGPPLRKFWKEDDRLERMWGGGTQPSTGQCFWNYFQYGLDFLISSEGTVTKILAHSNIPGTPLFQRYARCPWTLPTSSGSLDLTSSSTAFRSHLSASSASPAYPDEVHLAVPTPAPTATLVVNGNGKKKKRSGSNSPIGSGSTNGAADEVVKKVEKQDMDAMLLDRVVEGGLDGVINLGPSRLIGFDGLIIEEDQASGGICSVLVWRDTDGDEVA